MTRVLTTDIATSFTQIALSHVTREYPHKLDHVWGSGADNQSPRQQHPIFYGSFDWHSCVHGYWTLARLLRRFPNRPECKDVIALFNASFTPANVEAECAYLRRSESRGFERPYGWAWLLMLWAELSQHGQPWAATLKPLAEMFAQRFKDYLPLANYPDRSGQHANTAFAFALTFEYCDASKDDTLRVLLTERLQKWYGADVGAQAWEPSGSDFLSPTLMEAEAMRRGLPALEFQAWLALFLPGLERKLPSALFTPVAVSDRTDGKIAHLDGLNLSRAWCWCGLARALQNSPGLRNLALQTAEKHMETALGHVSGHYMGEHWLASFALLALEAAPETSTTKA
ncbi:MAG: DUF2891 domain-containing protein [Rhodospirillaceae bacterium]|nr:DUF2891 domain-containing protein [Rhodospirillaceae bacterium]